MNLNMTLLWIVSIINWFMIGYALSNTFGWIIAAMVLFFSFFAGIFVSKDSQDIINQYKK